MSVDVKERKTKILSAKTEPASLQAVVRKTPYQDYTQLGNERERYNRLADQYEHVEDLECFDAKDYFKIQIVLRERRRVAALEDNLPRVRKLDNLIKEISNFFTEDKLYTAKAERALRSELQHEAVTQKYYAASDKWGNKIETLEDKKEKADKKLIARGKNEMTDYDSKIPKSIPPPYRKYSAYFLNLHDMKRHAIVSKDMDSADQLDKKIQEQMKVEHQRMKEEYLTSFENKRKTLEARTGKRRFATANDWDRRINETDYKKNHELNPLQDARHHLDIKNLSHKAEYTGEEDLIVKSTNNRGLTQTRARTLKPTTRPVEPRVVPHSTLEKSVALFKASRGLDSKRWPE